MYCKYSELYVHKANYLIWFLYLDLTDRIFNNK